MTRKLTRREWLGKASAGVAALTWPGVARAGGPQRAPLPVVKLRANGKTVPRLGLGAFPITRVRRREEAVRVLRYLFDHGVRYVDTAPSYGRDASSERRLGEALAGCPREEFYLATKTLRRDEAGARRELEASLTRLRVDKVDAVQVHEIHDDARHLDPEKGVLKALVRAREEGLLDAIGLTCHRNPAHALQALERFSFHTVLCPVNPLDPQHLSFVKDLLPVARRRHLDLIAMKVFAGGSLVRRAGHPAGLAPEECLHYALSLDAVTVAVPGLQSRKEADLALAAARGFRPLARARLTAIEKRAGKHRGKASEWYKEP